jgi:dTDP-4-amino-4,6-dideoxygalactose transaminase
MEVCAIIGSLQLERFEETFVVRRALATRYPIGLSWIEQEQSIGLSL